MTFYILTRNQLSSLNMQGYVDILRDGKSIRVTHSMVQYGTFSQRKEAEKIEGILFRKPKPIEKIVEIFSKEKEIKPVSADKTSWKDDRCYYVVGKTIDRKTAILLGPFRFEKMAQKYAYFSVQTPKKSSRHSIFLTSLKKRFPSIKWAAFGTIQLPNGTKLGTLNDQVRGYKTNSARSPD